MPLSLEDLLVIEDAIETSWGSERQFGKPGLSAQTVLEELLKAGFVIVRDWRPIAEAPKDSVMALCFSDGEMRVGAFDGSWYDPWESADLTPTHFCPLPDPPKVAAKPMTPERLAEIKAIAEAKLPGPFDYEGPHKWIATARTAIPELIGEIERLRVELAGVMGALPIIGACIQSDAEPHA